MLYDLKCHNPVYTKFSHKWEDGVVGFGNGEMGAILWGDGAPFKITLDKMDYWELRTDPKGKYGPEHNWEDMKKMIAAKQSRRLRNKYEFYQRKRRNKYDLQPTRLPVPRLEINFNAPWDACNLELDLHDAQLKGTLQREDKQILIEGLLHSEKNILLINFNNAVNEEHELVQANVEVSYDHLDHLAKNTLKAWGYPPLEKYYFTPTKDHKLEYAYQKIPENQGGLLILHELEYRGEGSRLIVIMVSANNLKEKKADPPLKEQLIEHAMSLWQEYYDNSDDLTTYLEPHFYFWHEYWTQSAISIPDNIVENLYYLELYKLACNMRYGKYAVPLQGIWTKDGTMPPWCGDYHFDMNIQETYWPIFSSNRLKMGEPLYRWLEELIPQFEKHCKEFFGCEGIHTTCSISITGSNMHGYYTTEHWPGNTGWVAHMFWLYWLYSNNERFLRQKAFPFMRKAMQLYEFLLVEEENKYVLPLSTSPEYHENRIEAWAKNTNCDLAIIAWLTEALLESVEVLELSEEKELRESIEKWKHIRENLTSFPSSFSGFLVAENMPYAYPHRHMTHLFSIHPFHTVTMEGDRKDQFLIKSSLKHLRAIGNWEYSGWTLPWLSMMGSWGNNVWLAYRWLRDYFGFIKENSFHINGDINNYGISAYVYEPMTLEAGFCFISAVNEMILKSWGGIIRICEELPPSWNDIKFKDLRAEGAFLISGSIKDRELEWLLIKSDHAGICKLKNRFFGGKQYHLDIHEMKKLSMVGTIELNQEFGEFLTKPDVEYVVTPQKQNLKAVLEQIDRVEKEGLPPVDPLFRGNNWFGLKSIRRNPYLP